MHRRTPLLRSSAVAALAALALAPAAEAKVSAAEVIQLPRGGTVEPDVGIVTLQLSGGAKGKLSRAGVKLSASGDAEVKGAKISMPASTKGSVLDPITMKGTLVTDGGLTLRRGGRTAKLSKLTLAPGGKNRVTAKVGSKTVTLGTIKGGKARFRPYADGILTGATLKLSGSGAKALSKAVGGGFSAGTFAKVSATITMKELPLTAGSGKITLDPAFAGLLASNGLALTGTSGASVAGTVVTLPLTGGAFDPEGLSGRLVFGGQVQISRGADAIRLFEWATAIGAGQRDVFAKFDANASAAIFNADVSQMEVRLDGTAFSATGTPLTVAKPAAQALKASFNVDVPVGARMGMFEISGTTPAGG